MKLRMLPIAITILASFALLFGGWQIYRHIAINAPLKKLISAVPGVQHVQTQVTNNQVILQLKLNDNANLSNVYEKITTVSTSIFGNRTLKLEVKSDSSPELEQWWSSALFYVAQDMDTMHYAAIEKDLNHLAHSVAGLKINLAIDYENVYVRLAKDGHSKYIILPRAANTIAVLSNE